jgi:hypothetical protein
MARDIAQRETDQAGLRILNLGDPKAAGDATRTDNTTVPLPAAGTGSPGSSFLAAPADHVHPPSPGGSGTTLLHMEDGSEQSITGAEEELVAEFLVDMLTFGGPTAFLNVAALMKVTEGSANLRMRTGGTPGAPDGDEKIAGGGNSQTFAPVSASGGVLNVTPGTLLVKITVQNDSPTATTSVRAKSVTLSAGAGVPQD